MLQLARFDLRKVENVVDRCQAESSALECDRFGEVSSVRASSVVSSSSSVMPITPFIGVRDLVAHVSRELRFESRRCEGGVTRLFKFQLDPFAPCYLS
ncbi:MAG: hypothetical protein WKF84_04095 [Pyrinomonadaceae bacterium]